MYKVISLENTKQYETNFDIEYHSQYLNLQGNIMFHPHNNPKLKDFRCIVFIMPDGVMSADWFHKNDLELIKDEVDNSCK